MLSSRMNALAVAVLMTIPCLANPPAAKVQALKTTDDARNLTESVMKLVVADKIDDAFALLKPYWQLPASELDTVVMKTIAMRNTVADRFGRPTAYALVREEPVGDFLVRYIYVEKRERHPLYWMFVLYRPADQWTVDGASWNDNVLAFFSK